MNSKRKVKKVILDKFQEKDRTLEENDSDDNKDLESDIYVHT